MANATEQELAKLHGVVARTLSKQLDQTDTASLLLIDYADELPDRVKDFLEECCTVSPALLTVAARFLKDNDITCQPDDSKDMGDLEQRLREKTDRRHQKKRVGNVLPFAEDE